MIKVTRPASNIKRIVFDEGKTIEEVVRNAMNNPQGIGEDVPPMYTEKEKGVLPECDIRTDRQLLAIAACDKFTKSKIAKTEGISLAKKEGEDNKQQEGA